MPIVLNIAEEQAFPQGSKYQRHTGVTHGRASIGKNEVSIVCPYCETINDTALWSLSGSGKRCTGCFALINRIYAIRPNGKELKRLRQNDPRRALWEGK